MDKTAEKIENERRIYDIKRQHRIWDAVFQTLVVAGRYHSDGPSPERAIEYAVEFADAAMDAAVKEWGLFPHAKLNAVELSRERAEFMLQDQKPAVCGDDSKCGDDSEIE